MKLNTVQEQFLEFVRVGLFPGKSSARILDHGTKLDWGVVYQMAEEQSVIGLVSAGIDSMPSSERPPQKVVLRFIGSTLQLEQRNKSMNSFIAKLILDLRNEGINTLLVKGQGVAQCYEKPQWRVCGDVDLYLSLINYNAAREFLCAKAAHIDEEDVNKMHLAMTIDGWVVELHGTMYSDISARINKGLDEVHNNIFFGGEIRSWNNKGVTVFLPSANNDVIIVFSHILQHFFVEGIGLRQICDWCRLLYCYYSDLDLKLLESRIRKMGIMTEWKAFAALAVDFLGIPKDVMPFYNNASKWKKKGKKIMSLIFETGTFGHNRDLSYKQQDTFIKRLVKSFKRRNNDSVRQILIFPLDGLRMWWKMIVLGISVAVKGWHSVSLE